MTEVERITCAPGSSRRSQKLQHHHPSAGTNAIAQLEGQPPGSAGNVKRGPARRQRRGLGRTTPPRTVAAQREYGVRAIVPGCDPVEHRADLARVAGFARPGAAHPTPTIILDMAELNRPIGLGLAARGDVREAVNWAIRAERAGLESVWMHDSYFCL